MVFLFPLSRISPCHVVVRRMSIFLEHIKQLSGDSLFPLKLEEIRRSTIAITMQSRILECIVKEEQQEAKVKKESKKPLLSTQQRVNAWQRMVRMILWMIGNANVEYAANYLMTRHSISELQQEADEREKARLELERQKSHRRPG